MAQHSEVLEETLAKHSAGVESESITDEFGFTNSGYDEGLIRARVSVKWEIGNGLEVWYTGTVTGVQNDDYGRYQGVTLFRICYDVDEKSHWSELNAMVCGDVGDDKAEWSLLEVNEQTDHGTETHPADASLADAHEDGRSKDKPVAENNDDVMISEDELLAENNNDVMISKYEPLVENDDEEGNVAIDLRQWRSAENASGYRGAFCQNTGRYYATIMHGGKRHYLGLFGTAEEAATVYAREYIKVHGDPEEQGGEHAADDDEINLREWGSSRNSSGHWGVRCENSTGKCFAQIRHGGKRLHLGTFGTAEEAAMAYAREYIKMHRHAGGQAG